MRIYSMTATFGKLEHETLTLKPGLNVIQAGNEWGKSTWCAFLVAMLYGVETRSKSTRTVLADKERYAPWSGSPMEGRIDLNWQGRDITIERRTRGRVPLGDFRAYETESGLEIPELHPANCGQQLLGVERSVFLRSGFIRGDLSVTDDEALRRRLNNLVTTGDENGAADRLAQGLKELRNRIRYNRTGLLPQAEAERERLEQVCREQLELEEQIRKTTLRLEEMERCRDALENHRDALAYADSREAALRVAQAEVQRDAALTALETTSILCDPLPEREAAEEQLSEIDRLQDNLLALRERLQDLPIPEGPGPETEVFGEISGEEACEQVERHASAYRKLCRKRHWLPLLGMLLILAAAVAAGAYPMPANICAAVGILTLLAALVVTLLRRRQIRKLEERYKSDDPDQWGRMAQMYAAGLDRQREYTHQREELEQQLRELISNIRQTTQDQSLEQCRADWQSVIASWDSYSAAVRDYRRAEAHLSDLRTVLRPTPPPRYPDEMTFTEEETAQLLVEYSVERHRLENLLGQCQGRQAALEPRVLAEEKLTMTKARIQKLEQTYEALTIAQEALAEATAELQRRFAPRIARRAQALMSAMTGGRYDRLNLGEDLTIRAGVRQEDTLREALWRSDGTVDQLYLALRLAVAEELLPGAPLVLDDALVRFDDERMKAAVEILKTEARDRQVILFTCHSREADMT